MDAAPPGAAAAAGGRQDHCRHFEHDDNECLSVASLLHGMELCPGAALPPLHAVPRFSRQCQSMLLCGPDSSLRASLALHFAASRAATTQRPALLLCSRPHMEQQVPLLPFQADVGDASLELIHLKYMGGLRQLQQYAACMHLAQHAYSAIVVEDLSAFIRSDDRSALPKTLALLSDAAEAMRARGGAGGSSSCSCPLLVTDSSRGVDDAKRPVYVHQRWFPAMLQLQAAAGGGPAGRYTLSALQLAAGAGPPELAGLHATYSAQGQAIVLESLHFGAAPHFPG